jgi:hypothetical protein
MCTVIHDSTYSFLFHEYFIQSYRSYYFLFNFVQGIQIILNWLKFQVHLQDAHFPLVVCPLVKTTLLVQVVVILVDPVAAAYKRFKGIV